MPSCAKCPVWSCLRPVRTPSASRSCPSDPDAAAKAVAIVEQTAADEGLRVLGWRDVPVHPDDLGPTARSVMPAFRQVFLSRRRR